MASTSFGIYEDWLFTNSYFRLKFFVSRPFQSIFKKEKDYSKWMNKTKANKNNKMFLPLFFAFTIIAVIHVGIFDATVATVKVAIRIVGCVVAISVSNPKWFHTSWKFVKILIFAVWNIFSLKCTFRSQSCRGCSRTISTVKVTYILEIPPITLSISNGEFRATGIQIGINQEMRSFRKITLACVTCFIGSFAAVVSIIVAFLIVGGIVANPVADPIF